MIPNNKRIRVGVVGAGQIVRDFHLASLHAIPGISIDWICDIVTERAAELAAAFRIPRYYGSIQACPAVDMVLITTPVGVRKAVLDVVVSRGWHAYCEKPFARNANEHREMIDFARRQGVRLGAGYMRRQYYSTRTLQAVLNNEWLGSIQRVIAAFPIRLQLQNIVLI